MAGFVRAAVIVATIAWFSPLHGEKTDVDAALATTRHHVPNLLAATSGLADTRERLPPETRAQLDRMIADAALAAMRQAVPRP